MTNPRETVFAALFAQLQTASGFVTTSREVEHWANVAPSDQPALYVQELEQDADTVYRLPTKWHWPLDVIIYVHQQNLSNFSTLTFTVQLLNQQIDAVIAALAPEVNASALTLGGLVNDVRVHGKLAIHEGRNDAGRQAVAVIPVVIIPNV